MSKQQDISRVSTLISHRTGFKEKKTVNRDINKFPIKGPINPTDRRINTVQTRVF